ncbi:MAG: hypothetical protein WC969_12445 [Elusimicrobiota bacterium]|jgi:flagellar hook assembly protein FlgD
MKNALARATLLSGLAAALLVVRAAPASAQQVFINRLYVCNPANVSIDGQGRFTCSAPPANMAPGNGNISNEPHIEFDQTPTATCNGAAKPAGVTTANICNSEVFLCASIGWANDQSGSADIALDYINFEIFKFGSATNPLDTQSAPPLRTFFVDNPGIIPAGSNSDTSPALLPPTCVMWEGSYNILGEFGKTNGQFGFRATVATNQTSPTAGNINITMTRAYPSGATQDGDGTYVDQRPITVDVVNLHVVRTTPTVVGDLTGVAAEPYNITYRLSKDATMYLTIHNTAGTVSPVVRSVVPAIPRVGEGTPSGTLQNGDSWNGRWDNGDLAPPGVYLATLQAWSWDQYGWDLSIPVTRQVALDTLQVTDLRVQPLTDQSTSLAVLSYQITEPAVVYVDIFPPGTQFSAIAGCNDSPLNGINATCQDQGGNSPKNFNARLNAVAAPVLRHMEEQKDYRRSVLTIWDGRDQAGNILPDGDYVFVVYAAMPSQNGFAFLGNNNDKRIWSTNAKSGFLAITRGLVTISQVGPATTVIGSSPSVAGLDPFTFSYTLSRDAVVSLKIFDATGVNLIKTLVSNEQRPANFLNRERWIIPINDAGMWITSGTYLAQLTAADPFFPSKVSTTTALFPVNLFRIADVFNTPLLTGATDVVTLSYQLSQPMLTAWSLYPPGTIVTGSTTLWPPCGVIEPGGACGQVTNGGVPVSPIITIKGMRPGRLKITEFWDGRDRNGLFVPDGNYVFILAAQSTTTPRYFATDQILGNVTVARGSIVFPIFNVTPTIPTLFNSSQTIALPPYQVEYSLTRQSSVTIQILTTSAAPMIIRTLISGQVRDANILNREFWDARDDAGNFVTPGFYTVQAIAEDLASVLSSGSTSQQTISVNPLRVYDVAVSPLRPDAGSALIAYQVSETMKAVIKIYKPGTSFDRNGNPFPPESQSLVKRIVGVRPARTEISDIWDGTDEKLTIVPDGNYLFKIVASTDLAAIDGISGNVRVGASLAEDLIIAEVPVVRSGSADPAGDFENNSIVYPNPVRGSAANLHIYVPVEAKVSIRIYNLAGEYVFNREFGAQASDTYVDFAWTKTNNAGRTVAPGVYFLLIREDPTRGERTPLQSVRKVLIP